MSHILQQLIFPGVCVTLIAVVALVPTLWPGTVSDKNKKWWRALLIVLVCGLAVGEIWIDKNDRADAFTEHEEDMGAIFQRFGDLDKTMAALLKNEVVTQRTPANGDVLKRRALDLSNEILQFLLDREVVPGYGQGRFGEGPFGGKLSDTTEYDKETMDTYAKAYEPQVVSTYEAMKKRGVTDTELEQEISNPINTYSIRDIAQRLTTLASSMPN
ncbi:MAG TPA: hypothetical protein VNE63_22520 [Candidatus Acidoferrales bacterium]|nr:hypothetical protein [Candidatus Acidoferrales bacterium]